MLVQKKKCNQCLFSKNKIVSDKRREQILQECAMDDTYFICHKATVKEKDVCCRGFYDGFKDRSKHIAMAMYLKVLKFVEIK
jgi:hypothetical protein